MYYGIVPLEFIFFDLDKSTLPYPQMYLISSDRKKKKNNFNHFHIFANFIGVATGAMKLYSSTVFGHDKVITLNIIN